MRVRRFSEMGSFKNKWLDAHYHFNFNHYNEKGFEGFGRLLVLNDDIILKGQGFKPHFHENMEVITFIKKGQLIHSDDLNNKAANDAGCVQVFSAGLGIMHSEFAGEREDCHLLQIWLKPEKLNIPPRFEQIKLEEEEKFQVICSAKPSKKSLYINTKAEVCIINLQAKDQFTIPYQEKSYFVLTKGNMYINNVNVFERDGIFVEGERLELSCQIPSQGLLFRNL